MTRTIGIGVIGMGWMGEAHSRAYRAIPDRFPQAGIRPRLVVCADPVEDAYLTVMSGPAHPYHGHFNPAWTAGLGYDDRKTIEAYNFLNSIVTSKQGEPGFAEGAAVARVLRPTNQVSGRNLVCWPQQRTMQP